MEGQIQACRLLTPGLSDPIMRWLKACLKEGPEGGEVGLKDGSRSVDSVPFKEDVETTRALAASVPVDCTGQKAVSSFVNLFRQKLV